MEVIGMKRARYMRDAWGKARELRDAGALFVVSHSGGKDSQAMFLKIRELVPEDQILVVYAELGDETVWPATKAHIAATIGNCEFQVCKVVDAEMREFQAHFLPWLKKPVKTYTGGMMLVGDAGGFPCPLDGEGIWHACTSGRIAAETAAWAISKGDVSERALAEYERRWKASPLGMEHRFGPEFVELWDHSIFDPEIMKGLIQLLLEFSEIHPFSILFDWSDDHVSCLNQHIEHMFDMVPEFSDFASKYMSPLGNTISPQVVRRALLQAKPKVPLLKLLSDDMYLKVLSRLNRKLAARLDGV